MIKSGIVQIYPSRSAATQDLYEDLTDEDNTKIEIIGISLNDFALEHQKNWARPGPRSAISSARGTSAARKRTFAYGF